MTRSEVSREDLDGSRAASLVVRLSGLHCASCVGRVERAVLARPDVARAEVNLAAMTLTIAPRTADLQGVAEAVATAGYAVVPGERQLVLDGLHCASCVGRVEQALCRQPGVLKAQVNLAAGRADVVLLDSSVDLLGAVRQAGYGASDVDAAAPPDREAAQRDETRLLARDALAAAVLSLPLVLVEMGGHLLPALHQGLVGLTGAAALHGAELGLTTLVLLGPGRRFFTSGLSGLWRLAPDMNTLVALGAGAAYLFSAVATVWPSVAGPDVYFEAAAVIVTLVLTGRMLEARARGRTGAAIQRLVALQPAEAHRIGADGAVTPVKLAALRLGDRLVVKPGERVPVDGQVDEGASYLDESMLTGEAEPVAKQAGDFLTGGSVNGAGSLVLRVTALGADTALARIVAMVEAAQGAKLPVQALADRVTAWFVPAVLGIALATLAIWLAVGASVGFALINAVAVLIISCPCAMGLATPVSIMVATGRAAERGILFRQGRALQALAGVATVAFDKTGTLTCGKPTLVDCDARPGFERAEVLSWAAALETRSEHPLGRAIVAAAEAEGLALPDVSDVRAQAGLGLGGRVAGRAILIGSARLMRTIPIEVADPAAGAGSPLFCAVDGRLALTMRVADAVRPEAPATIAALEAQGVACAMLTGDAQSAAEAVGRALKIGTVVAELLPEHKVAALQRLDGPTAFVGDGINDAPVLAAAAVGIAVGTGTDVAIEAADVVIMADRLTGVGEAIKLSRLTMRNIRQNLFWAFAYNVVLIPVAAGALYAPFGLLLSPMLGAAAMALSSVFVVGNALRLRRFAG